MIVAKPTFLEILSKEALILIFMLLIGGGIQLAKWGLDRQEEGRISKLLLSHSLWATKAFYKTSLALIIFC